MQCINILVEYGVYCLTAEYGFDCFLKATVDLLRHTNNNNLIKNDKYPG